jgi:hypothetical protein
MEQSPRPKEGYLGCGNVKEEMEAELRDFWKTDGI